MIALVLIVCVSVGLAGCAPKAPPEVAERDSVFVAIASIGNTLDAAFANSTNVTIATSHIYDYMIAVDEDFNFEPGVASSWEQVDNKTFKFTVGDGFVFHTATRSRSRM